MTLILQCLSDLTPFLSVRSNAAAPPGRQAAVICCPSETRSPDTSIMDLYVLLNKWHNECRGGWKWLYFNLEQPGREGRPLTGDRAVLMMIKRFGIGQSSPPKRPNWSGWKEGCTCKDGIPGLAVVQNLHSHCVFWAGAQIGILSWRWV